MDGNERVQVMIGRLQVNIIFFPGMMPESISLFSWFVVLSSMATT
jgi:hypothetical protein